MVKLLRNITRNSNQVHMFQVHGNKVVAVDCKQIGKTITDCDSLITNDPKITLRISVADCIPIALYDPKTGSIGLIHAGWRGLSKNIINKTVSSMIKNYSLEPKNIIAEMGPHICMSHYEVKVDVINRFMQYPQAVRCIGKKQYLNLEYIARMQLKGMGVNTKNISFDKRCTYEVTSLPSYRRGDLRKKMFYYLSIPRSS